MKTLKENNLQILQNVLVIRDCLNRNVSSIDFGSYCEAFKFKRKEKQNKMI